ncbi:methyl-accepting chemotaxis protein [Bdellovibrio sp. SKB1291214]|uniref:methyl-accepting chemotaxis protein n=1 Tax=Bdellovibrio sp. SKB1291214 TaxID=1732569 RepID=UPI000B51A4C0|nr:methyl-accepting chemotaxis protein [Bdellovibrio sp. SKB1291214]UYL07419.1 methyl-accepting chemotaxis protein [Bdellovibrio sp. SKB1291214]
MLNGLRLSTKLILSFIFISIFVVAMGAIGLYAGKQLFTSIQNMNDNNLIPMTDLSNANMNAIYHNRELYDLVLSRDSKEIDESVKAIEVYKTKINALLDKYRKTFLTDREVDLLKKFDAAWPVYEKVALAVIHSIQNGNKADAEKLINSELSASFKIVDDLLSDLVNLNVELADNTNKDAASLFSKLSNITWTGMGVSLVLSVGIGLFLAKRISSSLINVASELSGASAQTASASTQLSSASQQVSSGTTESASSLEETVAALEELTSVVNNNAKNARNAAQLAKTGSTSAASGNEGMKRLIESMNEISNSAKKVEDIIGVIDDISFQINLLALNAAVEAARAGDHGKGFAVVADAVRNLAQKSATAAKDISELIRDSADKTQIGSKLASDMAVALSDLVLSIEKSATINDEIALASEEQATGITQISKAMQNLDASTQQNAASAEEIAASAEEMSAQAAMLQAMVLNLQSIVNGAKNNEA